MYETDTSYNRYQTIRLEKVKRGEIYYFKTNILNSDGIQSRTRPYVVISNDTGNTNSKICIAIPLTTKEKRYIPTHCKIYATGIESTVLAEQASCMSQNDIEGECIGVLNENELEEVEKCLIVSLGIKCNPKIGNKIVEKYYSELEKRLAEDNFKYDKNDYLTKYVKVPVIEKTYVEQIMHNQGDNRLHELEIENAKLKSEVEIYKSMTERLMNSVIK